MSRLLSNPPQYSGLSKRKILWVGGCVCALLLIGLFYGVFKSDKEDTESNSNLSQTYISKGSGETVNQIMQQIDASKVKLVSSTVMTKVKVESLTTNNELVPPIIDADEAQLQKQIKQSQHRFKQKLEDNKYASVSARTLMFSSIASKVMASQTQMAKSIAESDAAQVINSEYNSKPGDKDKKQSPDNLEKPRSPYELKAGSIIPAIMINGINSDLAGAVVAQVRENIYDSSTRRYLLIPQGSKLIGRYDSNVIYGQERLLVAWTRLIYPNGSSITLSAIPGTDLEGYSGFHDQVDNKYWKIFGASFIMGVITAGMQYSQNNTNANVQSGGVGYTSNPNPSVGQTLSGSLGQQLGQTGLAVTQKNLNLQPTLTIRPNYPFSLIMTADLVLKPYIKTN